MRVQERGLRSEFQGFQLGNFLYESHAFSRNQPFNARHAGLDSWATTWRELILRLPVEVSGCKQASPTREMTQKPEDIT